MRILLVDDSPDVPIMLKSLLEHSGHQVRCAFAGGEAMSVATDFSPEAICLDLGLPDMDGYQLATRLRQEVGLSAARIIAVTGSLPEPIKLQQAGIDGHMLKPVRLADVLKAIVGQS